MRRVVIGLLAAALLVVVPVTSSGATVARKAPRPGQSCATSPLGRTVTSGNLTVKCERVGKTRRWKQIATPTRTTVITSIIEGSSGSTYDLSISVTTVNGKHLNLGQLSVSLVDTDTGAVIGTWSSQPSASATTAVRVLQWNLSSDSSGTVVSLGAPVQGVVWSGPSTVTAPVADPLWLSNEAQATFAGGSGYAASESGPIGVGV